MFRVAVIILLAVDLLVCPIRCGIHASDEVLKASAKVDFCSQATACCCDCEGRPPLRAGEQPLSERPPSDPASCCEDCFCDGAILPDIATFELGSPIVWLSSRSTEAAANSARFRGRSVRDMNQPPKPGGTDARVLYQSWQI
jgi:hypothetical protein